MPPPKQIWDAAIAELKAGRPAEAQSLFRKLHTLHPNNPDVLHMLGIASVQSGQITEAIDWISRAIALKPAMPDYHNNLSAALCAAGRADEAIFAARRALELRPDYAPAFFNLGKAFHLRNRLPEAIAAYTRAVALIPNEYGPWVYLASALQQSGRFIEAIEAHRRTLALSPNDWATQNNLGICLLQSGQLDAAIAVFQAAIAMNPACIDPRSNLIYCLQRAGRIPDAVAAGQQAIAIRQDHPETLNNFANALKEAGRAEEAIPLYEKAAALRPNYAEALNNLAIAQHDLGHLDQAIITYLRSIAADPNFAPAHWNYGLALLKQGKLRQGWPEYEWRFRAHQVHQPGADSGAPLWDGTPLQGRRILLHGEQGFGDMLQFARYIPQVAARGGKIILYCHKELLTLMRTLPGIDQLAEVGHAPPACDVHSPLLSLPRIFDTTLENIPAQVPYLSPDADLQAQWKARIAQAASPLVPAPGVPDEGEIFRVGLIWAGRPLHRYNPRYQRAVPLSEIASSFAHLKGIQFFPLQTGDGAGEILSAPQLNLPDWSPLLTDFAQTAAAMTNLDLIITIDTAAAHLAGALARPTWVLLPTVADWRWMIDREDSPWYPTMRLFRQPTPGDWSTPLARISDELLNSAAGKSSGHWPLPYTST